MTEVSARKYLWGNAKTNLVRQGVSTLTNLVLIPFVIRHIGLDKYSYVALTSFFISFSSFFDLGLSKSLVYLLNEPKVDIDKRNGYITAQAVIVGVLCILVLSVGIVVCIKGIPMLGESLPATDPYYKVVLLSGFIVLILTFLDQFLCAVLESYFLLPHVNYGLTVKIVTLNVLYMVNLFTFNSLSFYVMSSVFAMGTAVTYYTYIIRKHVRWHLCKPSREMLKNLGKHSFHFFRFSILNSLYSVLPRLSVMYISTDLSYVGILDVIEKLSLSIINLCSSILRPLFSLSRQTPHKIARQLTKVMMLNGAIGLAFVAVIIGANSFIVNYFFSHTDFDVSFIGLVLILYSLGSFFLLMGQPLSFYLQGEGKAKRLSMLFGINIFLFLLLYIGMKEWFQINALINLSVCYLIVSAVYLYNLYGLARTTRRFRLLAY